MGKPIITVQRPDPDKPEFPAEPEKPDYTPLKPEPEEYPIPGPQEPLPPLPEVPEKKSPEENPVLPPKRKENPYEQGHITIMSGRRRYFTNPAACFRRKL